MSLYNERFLETLDKSKKFIDEFEDGVREHFLYLYEDIRKSLVNDTPENLIEYATLYECVMNFVRYIGWFYPYFRKNNPKREDEWFGHILQSYKECSYWKETKTEDIENE
jgi:hypothetical protein